jgi:hypothetical protein
MWEATPTMTSHPFPGEGHENKDSNRVTKSEVRGIIELRDHIALLTRIYTRQCEIVTLKVIAGAPIEPGLNLGEIDKVLLSG